MPSAQNIDASRRIDEYVNAAQPFAKPILQTLRQLVRKEIPMSVETWKWNAPNIEFNGPLCMIWSFKKHAAIHFFRGAEMNDPDRVLEQTAGGNVASRFIRLESIEDLDEPMLSKYLKEAARVNESGKKKSVKKMALTIPEELSEAFLKSKKFRDAFYQLKPGVQNQQLKFIGSAKLAATRKARVDKLKAEIL
jgi:uncharacterized protein YdeI (YjbR/CyaY-like superfamily)